MVIDLTDGEPAGAPKVHPPAGDTCGGGGDTGETNDAGASEDEHGTDDGSDDSLGLPMRTDDTAPISKGRRAKKGASEKPSPPARERRIVLPVGFTISSTPSSELASQASSKGWRSALLRTDDVTGGPSTAHILELADFPAEFNTGHLEVWWSVFW